VCIARSSCAPVVFTPNIVWRAVGTVQLILLTSDKTAQIGVSANSIVERLCILMFNSRCPRQEAKQERFHQQVRKIWLRV
jgi:hypothetical protein